MALDPTLRPIDLEAARDAGLGFSVVGFDPINDPKLFLGGDVNGDGRDDLLAIGGDGVSNVFALFGKGDGETVDLRTIEADGAGYEILVEQNGRFLFPNDVRFVGDANGDGLDDLVLGAAFEDTGFLVFGQEGSNSVALDDPEAAIAYTHSERANDEFGSTLGGGGGDFDGDGLADFAFGAPRFEPFGAQPPGPLDFAGAGWVVATPPEVGGGDIRAFGDALFFTSDLTEGFFPSSLDLGGDFDGDGFADLVVTGDGPTSDAIVDNEGLSFVLLGAAGGSAGVVDLEARFPRAEVVFVDAAYAGDVDGDGRDDAIVSTGSTASFATAGRVFVVFGKDGDEPAALSAIAAGRGGYEVTGAEIGQAVAALGDLNGDGVGDYVIGAPDAGAPSNRGPVGGAYVVFGGGAAPDLDAIARADGGGFFVAGPTDSDLDTVFNVANAGFTVGGGGDFDGDGVDDVLIGSLASEVQDMLTARWVVLGKDDPAEVQLVSRSDLDVGQGAALGDQVLLPLSGDEFFTDAGFAGDLDGDGFEDAVWASPGDGGVRVESRIAVDFGGGLRAQSVAAPPLDGSDRSLTEARAVGDVNGDGLDDLYVGDGRGDNFVLFGDPEGQLATPAQAEDDDGGFRVVDRAAFEERLDPSGDLNGDGAADRLGLAGEQLVVVFGEEPVAAGAFEIDGGSLGAIVALEDLNGDGRADAIVSVASNRAFVVFGGQEGARASLDDVARGVGGYEVVGDGLGTAVAGLGDIDGDGRGDFVVGAQDAGADTNRGPAGGGFVVFGAAEAPSLAAIALGEGGGFFIDGPEPSPDAINPVNGVGVAVGGGGDFDGDGVGDILISSDSGADTDLSTVRWIVFGKGDGDRADLIGVRDEDFAQPGQFVATDDFVRAPISGEEFVTRAAFAGDLDGDGFGDAVWVVSGDVGATVESRLIVDFGGDQPNESSVEIPISGVGERGFLQFTDAAGLSDVNGDGVDDLYARAIDGAGAAGDFVFFGDAARAFASLEQVIDGQGGFEAADRAQFEDQIDPSGDFDADGTADRLYRVSDDRIAVDFGEGSPPMLDRPNGLPQTVLRGDGATNFSIVFESENSISADSLGFYEIAADGTIGAVSFLFPNANRDGSNDGSIGVRPGERAEIGVLAEGAQVGLFLVNNGFSQSNDALFSEEGQFAFRNPHTGHPANIADFTIPELVFTFENGHERVIRDAIYHTADASPETTDDNRVHPDRLGHVASQTLDDGAVRIGFDDRENSSSDFDGLVVRIERDGDDTPEPATGFDITDGAGDAVSYRGSQIIGDIDGDGRDEVGVRLVDRATGEGAAFVALGKADGDDALLADLIDGDGGFAIVPETLDGFRFDGLSAAGDVNGDGAEDFLVGGFATGIGAIDYLVYGGGDLDQVDLAGIAAGEGGFRIDGGGSFNASNGGDFDGDGFDDLVFADELNETYVLFGAAENASAAIGAGDGRSVRILEANGGATEATSDVVFGGDVNGDGLDDIVVTTDFAEDSTGSAYVVFGAPDAKEASGPEAFGGFEVLGFEGAFGGGVNDAARAGDVNGDGLDDIYLNTFAVNLEGGQPGGFEEGDFIVFGKADEADLDLRDVVENGQGFELANGDPRTDQLSALGDVNGDGVGDRLTINTANNSQDPLRVVFGDEPAFDPAAYDTLIGFGDSLVDSGNAQLLANALGADDPAPAALGYADGRFSSGANVFDLLFGSIAQTSAFDFAASTEAQLGLDDDAGGLNFAVGGARATSGELLGVPGVVQVGTGLAAQVESYEALLSAGAIFGGETPENALVAIHAGGNDVRDFLVESGGVFTPEDVGALASAIAQAQALAIGDLIDAGASDFLVAGVGNIGAIPETANGAFGGDLDASLAALQPLTDAVNDGIEAALGALEAANPALDLFFFRPESDAILEDPQAFEITQPLTTPFVDAFADGAAGLEDVDRFGFLDSIHPTAPAQLEFAREAFDADLVAAASIV